MNNGSGDDGSYVPSTEAELMDELPDPYSLNSDASLAAELPEDNVCIGTPAADSEHWHQQTAEYNCAVEAQRGILEALTGRSFLEIDLTAEAAQHGWMTVEDGTPLFDTDKILQHYGVETHQVNHASIGDIIEELTMGHKVIVGVNSDTLLSGHSFPVSEQGADHAIWVTGVDTSDPSDIRIIVNDSADPEGAGKSYSLQTFKEAWQGSDFFYTATDHAPDDLHLTAPGFDADQGVFTDMAHWVKEHFPSPGTLMGGAAMVGSAVDIVGRERVETKVKSLAEKIGKRSKRLDKARDDQHVTSDTTPQQNDKTQALNGKPVDTATIDPTEQTSHTHRGRPKESLNEKPAKSGYRSSLSTQTKQRQADLQEKIIQRRIAREKRQQKIVDETLEPVMKNGLKGSSKQKQKYGKQQKSTSADIIYLKQK